MAKMKNSNSSKHWQRYRETASTHISEENAKCYRQSFSKVSMDLSYNPAIALLVKLFQRLIFMQELVHNFL
jgi:hypothetical protein